MIFYKIIKYKNTLLESIILIKYMDRNLLVSLFASYY